QGDRDTGLQEPRRKQAPHGTGADDDNLLHAQTTLTSTRHGPSEANAAASCESSSSAWVTRVAGTPWPRASRQKSSPARSVPTGCSMPNRRPKISSPSYRRLLTMTNVTGTRSREAACKPWIEYIADPSPRIATTRRPLL